MNTTNCTGGMGEIVSSSEYKGMANWFAAQYPQGLHSSLKQRMDHLMLRSFMARSQLTRMVRLSEMGLEEVEGECCNDAPAYALRLTVKNGKTNKFGRPTSVGLFRHKDVEFCAFGALGLYFFWRFQIQEEAPPNFLDRHSWYDSFMMICESFFLCFNMRFILHSF